MSNKYKPVRDSTTLLRFSIWWCGDEYCNCHEFRIEEFNNKRPSYMRPQDPDSSDLYCIGTLWTGSDPTDCNNIQELRQEVIDVCTFYGLEYDLSDTCVYTWEVKDKIIEEKAMPVTEAAKAVLRSIVIPTVNGDLVATNKLVPTEKWLLVKVPDDKRRITNEDHLEFYILRETTTGQQYKHFGHIQWCGQLGYTIHASLSGIPLDDLKGIISLVDEQVKGIYSHA